MDAFASINRPRLAGRRWPLARGTIGLTRMPEHRATLFAMALSMPSATTRVGVILDTNSRWLVALSITARMLVSTGEQIQTIQTGLFVTTRNRMQRPN